MLVGLGGFYAAHIHDFDRLCQQLPLHPAFSLFGVWRQSLDRDQSIFALHNVSDEELRVSPTAVNLIEGETWLDLLTGEEIDANGEDIVFAAYQCRWITNRW